MASNALTTAGRFRFVASDRTGRPWTTLPADRGVRMSGSGSLALSHPSMIKAAQISAPAHTTVMMPASPNRCQGRPSTRA